MSQRLTIIVRIQLWEEIKLHQELFARFESVIRTLSEASLSDAAAVDRRLLLAEEGSVRIYYAPFDFVNRAARVVVVGLTPGWTQMSNALREVKSQLAAGKSSSEALRAAKKTASFSGSMRPNLIALLDGIGLQRWLGIRSCDELFSGASELVHTTSVLRYPVFVDGANYSGAPAPLAHPLLRRFVLEYFALEARELRDAAFVPLGDKAAEVLRYLVSDGAIEKARVLDGLPHPSGANAERIAYFLGQKARERLSRKTDPAKLDAAKATLMQQVTALGGGMQKA